MYDYRIKLQIKNEFLKASRNFLAENDFLEIQTPKISFIPTDIREHLFKVDYFGTEAYLIQTSQFYRQAYVINGVESVFEIGPAFRAEPRITSRHLSEFISLDVESSKFNELEKIISFESNLIKHTTSHLLRMYDVKPIQTFEIVEYDDIKKLLNLEHSTPLKNEHEAEICRHYDSDGVFIINYPSSERAFLYEDINGITLSYDLLVDGLEITSGGIRDPSKENMIRKMNKDNIEPTRYAPFLNLFDGDIPVRGGFAIGVERILSRYLGLSDVSDILPYSKKPYKTGDDLIWKQ